MKSILFWNELLGINSVDPHRASLESKIIKSLRRFVSFLVLSLSKAKLLSLRPKKEIPAKGGDVILLRSRADEKHYCQGADITG